MDEKNIQVFDSTLKSYKSSVIANFNYLKDAYMVMHNGAEVPDQDQWNLY
jgi:hypothetical protein